MKENKIDIPLEIQQLINSQTAHHYQIVPYKQEKGVITFIISNTCDYEVITNELEVILGSEIKFLEVDESSFKKNLFLYYRINKEVEENPLNLEKEDFLKTIIFEAKNIGSSDIHFESYKETARIRFRIDGILVEKFKVPKENYLELINKIKIEANLDITEKRLPQDGRIYFNNLDIRVSILPTLYGEKVVMRLLGKETDHLFLEDLGFDKEQEKVYLESIKKTKGIVLISGPTGSGKTTTLYTSLKLLNEKKRNIVTIEDPIEYTLEGVNQVQLKENIGLTFASALKSFLRQDPDIIMLGEIRDSETANMAIRASLTGHLVLSTIHTNSAIGTISRLIDMGIPPFYIADTLNVSVAQRLIRKLCTTCKEEISLDKTLFPSTYIPPINMEKHFIHKGCSDCFYTGYSGRNAIYEVMPIDKELIGLIKTSYNNIDDSLLTKKYIKLSDKAFELFYNGITSLEEVYPLLTN